MKLYTYQNKDGIDRLGIGYLDKPELLWSIETLGVSFADMNDLITHITPEQKAKLAAPDALNLQAAIKIEDVRLRAPIPYPLQDVLCLGINYDDHAAESARYHEDAFSVNRQKAVYFSKRVAEAIGQHDPIPRYAELVDSLDHEAELGVIIGKDCKNVPEDKVQSYIFGYTILNDVTARNLQTAHSQWYFGKSLDGFTPMGPCILTADEVAFPPALHISSSVNGELRQDSCTDLQIHSIAEVVAELSRGMTLRAGTIIATGTPAGVGMGMMPPQFLKTGDVVTCEIEKIGTLTNIVE